MKKKPLKTIGWREQVALPDLKIQKIKAKVDTGAKTSSLHADNRVFYKRGLNEFVKFNIRSGKQKSETCKAKVLERRKVKSSNGQSELRPVILTTVRLLGESWKTEITLADRSEMNFPMLLGRESISGKFLVDTSGSFYGARKEKK